MMQHFATADILVFSLLAGVIVAATLTSLSTAGKRARKMKIGSTAMIGGVAAAVGFAAWNFLISGTGALDAFNVDAPLIGLSWADAGSGIAVFVATVACLTLLEPRSPATQVVGRAAISGLTATLLDLFVL